MNNVFGIILHLSRKKENERNRIEKVLHSPTPQISDEIINREHSPGGYIEKLL